MKMFNIRRDIADKRYFQLANLFDKKAPQTHLMIRNYLENISAPRSIGKRLTGLNELLNRLGSANYLLLAKERSSKDSITAI